VNLFRKIRHKGMILGLLKKSCDGFFAMCSLAQQATEAIRPFVVIHGCLGSSENFVSSYLSGRNFGKKAVN